MPSRFFSYPLLPISFYQNKVQNVAKALLGKGLFVAHPNGPILVAILETESYEQSDPASHSYSGPTKRCQPMFEQGGIAYVYVSYGVHYCFNVVTGPKDQGDAVLIRAAQPIEGVSLIQKNRASPTPSAKPFKTSQLLNGPGKLTQALGIDLSFNKKRLNDPNSPIQIYDLGISVDENKICRTPRIGISKSKDSLERFLTTSLTIKK